MSPEPLLRFPRHGLPANAKPMNLIGTNLKLLATAVFFALMLVGLIACDSEPSPTPVPEPTASATAKAVEPIATTVPVVATSAPSPDPTVVVTATVTVAPTPKPTVTVVPIIAPDPSPDPTVAVTATVTVEPTVAVTATVTVEPTSQVTVTVVPGPEQAVSVAPVSEAGEQLPLDPKVVRGTLSNGLTYYVRHNEEPRDRAQLALVVRAGSVLEEEDQRGLAHFLEHMAFNGTERFAKQEIVEYIESIGSTFGADLNASTGFDNTLYWLEIPTDDPEITETAFQILGDWAYAITLDPVEVDLERDVVFEEWRLGQGFDSRLQDNLLTLIFGASRYADRAPIGLTEVIKNAPVERIRDFYERWYRPDHMAVIAVGDFNTDEIAAKVREHFAPPPEGQATQAGASSVSPIEKPRYEIPSQATPQIEVFTDPESPGTQFILVRKLSPDAGQDLARFRRHVVGNLAFMMLNARLFELAQSEDPPFLWAGARSLPYVETLDILTFSSWVEQDGVERGFAAMLEELQRVHQHGFTESELAREKANLFSSIESAYKQRDQIPSGRLVNSYLNHFVSGSPEPGIEAEWELYQEVLPQISLTEFKELADFWTQLEDTALLVVRPEGKDSIPDSELAAATLAQLEGAAALEVGPYVDSVDDVPLLATLPTPGEITETVLLVDIDAIKWTLSNGITVIAKQTDFRNDEVIFSAYSPGGHSLVSDEDHVSALYADVLVSGSGVGLHDSVALDKLLAGKRAAVSPFIGELNEGFRGSASPEDLETLFQLISLYATAPRLDPVYFDRYVSSLQSVAESRAADPDSVFSDAVTRVLSQNHHRARPLTVELLEELSIERAEAVYADRFADLGDATFVFVGAFDWNELRSLTTTYLASLPSTGRAEQWRDVGIDPPAGLEDLTVRRGSEPRSRTALIFAGEAEWTRQEAFALSVAGEMLGIRLRERVREELGGTYSIWVDADGFSLLPDSEYQVVIVFGSDPARADELLGEVLIEVEWLRAGGEQEYLDTVKEQLRTSRVEQLRDNGFWLARILRAVQRTEPFSDMLNFEQRLDALSLADVEAVALLFLPADRYVRVVLLPEEG